MNYIKPIRNVVLGTLVAGAGLVAGGAILENSDDKYSHDFEERMGLYDENLAIQKKILYSTKQTMRKSYKATEPYLLEGTIIIGILSALVMMIHGNLELDKGLDELVNELPADFLKSAKNLSNSEIKEQIIKQIRIEAEKENFDLNSIPAEMLDLLLDPLVDRVKNYKIKNK